MNTMQELPKELIIKKSRKILLVFFVLSVVLVFLSVRELSENDNSTFYIILVIVLSMLTCWFLAELIRRKPEIILTAEGIELREGGFFVWALIDSFSTVYYNGSDNYRVDLVLHTKGFGDINFDISKLEKSKERLADLIMIYKGSASLYFEGHSSTFN